MILHGRIRRRLALLASGILEGTERRAVEEHVARCRRCREELDELNGVLAVVASDPIRRRQPSIPLASLVTRVQARLRDTDEIPTRHALPWSRVLATVTASAALVAAIATLFDGGPIVPAPVPAVLVSEQFLDRMERNLVREQAARYLDEAQDVLVNVAASPRNCDRDERLDMADEAERSRRLLARRALLVEMNRSEVASAVPVLEDVEHLLREVAALPSCARPGDLDSIHREISERHLLMKISLVSRELQG